MNNEQHYSWHFPSKGEFPESMKRVLIGVIDGGMELRKISPSQLNNWKDGDVLKDVYCWKYCDDLPPVPQAEPVKESEDDLKKWLKEHPSFDYIGTGDARQIWNAAIASLKEKE